MKSCHEKDVQRVDTEKLEYLYKLRQEAYHDLHVQLQSYNDAFIARMQYMESNPAMSSDESQCSTDTDSPEMQSLVDMFEAGTVKDYSPLIEWEESYQVNQCRFSLKVGPLFCWCNSHAIEYASLFSRSRSMWRPLVDYYLQPNLNCYHHVPFIHISLHLCAIFHLKISFPYPCTYTMTENTHTHTYIHEVGILHVCTCIKVPNLKCHENYK